MYASLLKTVYHHTKKDFILGNQFLIYGKFYFQKLRVESGRAGDRWERPELGLTTGCMGRGVTWESYSSSRNWEGRLRRWFKGMLASSFRLEKLSTSKYQQDKQEKKSSQFPSVRRISASLSSPVLSGIGTEISESFA